MDVIDVGQWLAGERGHPGAVLMPCGTFGKVLTTFGVPFVHL